MKKNVQILFSIGFVFALCLNSFAQGGFRISGTNLVDANGNTFVMKGFNIPTAWYVNQVNTNIANMKQKTNANTLRIVVQTSTADADWQASVNNCIANNIIPMVELHDVTCGTSTAGLQNMANFWASKASFLKQPNIARYILINIANEWGDWFLARNSGSTWRDAYVNAISTLRAAGITTTIVVDAPNCGQDIQMSTLRNFAPTVLNSDPLKNILFSVHMYCEWSSSGGSRIGTDLPALKNAGIPIIVGEFGWQENNGSGGFCSIDAANIINTCQSNGIGWLAWSWTGNNSQTNFLDMATDFEGTSFTNWGNLVVNGSNGTKTAQQASVFGSTGPVNPPVNLGTNVALNKTVSVSSTEAGSGNVASNINDGNLATRWSSIYADNQTVTIDLGANFNITALKLQWEAAYARTYDVLVSNDNITYTNLFSVANGLGGVETRIGLTGAGRYLRLNLRTRATQWGFSLFEVEVYGTPGTTIPPANTPPTVAFTSPANGATFTAPASISVAVNATDADGVANVRLNLNNTLVRQINAAPYAWSSSQDASLSNLAAGSYSLTAIATDTRGASSQSVVNFVVNTGTTTVTNTGSVFSGPTCGRPSQSIVYTLNTAALPSGANNFSWWFTGSSSSVTTSANRLSATIALSQFFTSGQVCVGYNLTSAPWYDQKCSSTISVCPARYGVNEVIQSSFVVYPNPSNGGSIVVDASFKNEVPSLIQIVSSLGAIVYESTNPDLTTTINVSSFSEGHYTVKSVFQGSVEVQKVLINK